MGVGVGTGTVAGSSHHRRFGENVGRASQAAAGWVFLRGDVARWLETPPGRQGGRQVAEAEGPCPSPCLHSEVL